MIEIIIINELDKRLYNGFILISLRNAFNKLIREAKEEIITLPIYDIKGNTENSYGIQLSGIGKYANSKLQNLCSSIDGIIKLRRELIDANTPDKESFVKDYLDRAEKEILDNHQNNLIRRKRNSMQRKINSMRRSREKAITARFC